MVSQLMKEKTELLNIYSRFRTRSLFPPITFNKSHMTLHPTRCARNLGVLFDNQLTLTDHNTVYVVRHHLDYMKLVQLDVTLIKVRLKGL